MTVLGVTTHEGAGEHGILIRLCPGWKENKAVVRVQYPKGCNSNESVGDLPSVLETALNDMRQDIEREVRRAKKKLAAFETQCSEVMAAISEIKSETG